MMLSILRMTGCLLLLAPIGLADDWPQWRGPQRDGIWREEGITGQLPDGQIPLEWSVAIGPGYSGPTVADGRVYVTDRQVADGRQTERVLCFDSESGKEIWKHEYDAPYTISYTAGPRASVTVHQGRAYAVGAMGHFHCFNAATGEIIWRRDLSADYDVRMPIWGIAAAPLIYNGLVIQQVAGAGDACMVAFDAESGKEVWHALDEVAGYASPILIQQAGQEVAVCWTGESLSGLDPQTGKVHWSHEMKASRMPIGIGTPAVDGELIFVSSFYDGSLMIRAPRASLTSELVWRAVGVDEKKTGATSVQLGDRRVSDGQVYGIHAMIGTCIVEGGFVYGADSHGEFRCLEATTGRRVWEDQNAVPRNRWATIHMVRQADKVWMFNERGELLVTRLSPQRLEIIDRAQLIEPTRAQLNQRDGVCWSHPGFAERSVFARNDERLVRASLAQ